MGKLRHEDPIDFNVLASNRAFWRRSSFCSFTRLKLIDFIVLASKKAFQHISFNWFPSLRFSVFGLRFGDTLMTAAHPTSNPHNLFSNSHHDKCTSFLITQLPKNTIKFIPQDLKVDINRIQLYLYSTSPRSQYKLKPYHEWWWGVHISTNQCRIRRERFVKWNYHLEWEMLALLCFKRVLPRLIRNAILLDRWKTSDYL